MTVLIPALFWLLVLVCCAYAAAYGGSEGRWAAFLIVLASVLSVPATLLGSPWGATELALFLVDLWLLLALFWLMLTSNRYWPIWMTGFHLLAVVSHLSTLLAPDFAPKIYRAVGTVWAVPVLLSMAIGIAMDRRMQAHMRTLWPVDGREG